MHDSEPDTMILKTYPERLGEILSEIGIDSSLVNIGTDDVEKDGDYYSRCFSQTPRMITNKGCLVLKKSNFDVVQIIQKG
jgi:hypothetical protein